MDVHTLKRVIQGDKDSFSKFYSANFDILWRYVLSRVRDRDVASDIVSESFVSLFENVKNVKNPKALKSYLYKIAKNKMIQFYSREKTIALSGFDLDRFEVKEKGERKIPKKMILKLEEVLEMLPENYAEVLRLRFLSGLKLREVAEVLGKKEGNVKVIQNRAIKKAKEIVYKLYKIKC